MKKQLSDIDRNQPSLIIGLEKRANLAIQNHFNLSNYQVIVLCWFKGLWTGILLSLIVHYFIRH